MIDQLNALLLPIDDDLIEVRSADLLGLDHQLRLVLVCEVNMDLVEWDLLTQVSIHLGDVLWVQAINSSDLYVRHVQKVSSNSAASMISISTATSSEICPFLSRSRPGCLLMRCSSSRPSSPSSVGVQEVHLCLIESPLHEGRSRSRLCGLKGGIEVASNL